MIIEKNESGFYRISIPVPRFIGCSTGMSKIRLNYWPIDTAENNPKLESIHDHPSYFESFIVKGGYQHAIYNQLKEIDILSYPIL